MARTYAPSAPIQTPPALAWMLFLLAACAALPAHAQHSMPIDLANGWEQRTQGPWRIRYDHRALLAMRHPWEESHKGDCASVFRQITVPADWHGPIVLTFYCSDDYNAEGIVPDDSWLTAEGFQGHRFKQVLVDDRIIWSADVADTCPNGTPEPFRVPLAVKPGQKFMLTLLAYDLVDSRTLLEKDFYQSGDPKKAREADPDAYRFMTHVYWGDCCLAEADTEIKPARRPSDKALKAFHTDHWPLPPFGEPWNGPITLDVSKPAGVPKEGFPLRGGIPIHSGKAPDTDHIALRANGRPMAARKTVSNQWPDGSLQWVLLDFPVSPQLNTIELAIDRDPIGPDKTVRVKPLAAGASVDTGDIHFESRPDALLGDIRYKGAAKCAHAHLSALVDGEEIHATPESFSAYDEGPFRYTLEIDGRLDSLETTLAHFRLYASAYTGMPYLQCWLRLINDTPKRLPIGALRLAFELPEKPVEPRVMSGPVGSDFILCQVSEKERRLNGAEVNPVTPQFVAWKGAAIAVRHFRELYPKAAILKDTTITIDLAAAESSPVVFTPGEAKSHEIWLAFGDVDPVAFAAAVSAPPVLRNAAYFCATGAFGPAATTGAAPALCEYTQTTWTGKTWEELGQHFGIRDFPDSAYFGGLPKWCNNYYERMLGLWAEWITSGDRPWFDRAVDVCRHVMDVSVIHGDIPGKDWKGAMHGPGEDHVPGPWCPNLRTEGLAWFAHLTGEPEAQEAVADVADFCMRSHAGMKSPSVRDHAGPLDAIYSAFELMGEPKYIDDESARVAQALAAMDTRRGAWLETHGSRVYKGNVPWMMAQLARPLYLWYRATGDLQAAEALVGMADSIVCENTDWDTPGAVSGYSHNPHYPPSSNYDLIVLPVIFTAYELTQDPFFLDAAKAQWERLTAAKTFDSPLNCFWNTPWLMNCLKRYNAK